MTPSSGRVRIPEGGWSRLSVLLLVSCACGCATAPRGGDPLADVHTAPLSASGDAREMTAVALRHAGYATGFTNLVAAYRLAGAAAAKTGAGRDAHLVHARCALFVASLLPDEGRAAAVAREGLAAARRAGGDAGDAEAAYYGATHLGLVLRTQGLGAAGRLKEMESWLQRACAAPATDQGGPLRVLGMLYLRAPAWPTGIGDMDQALEYLGKAARDYPAHPANPLYLAHALKADGRRAEALKALDAAMRALDAGSWGDFAPLWRAEADALQRALKP